MERGIAGHITQTNFAVDVPGCDEVIRTTIGAESVVALL
jgi:hypothetical protein